MEPPLKRQRLGVSQEQLLHKRARNDLRLKSRFESIFEKFSKDFTGVGDEIDLETGKVVVNNGHLTTMQGELDAEGLANEEDELATDAPVKHGSSQQSGLNGALLMNSQEDEDNSVQRVHEGPYGPEVACIGSSIAAALKMEDGSSYDSSVHGELFIPKNVLSQLSRLGPHIRKSIANVQRSSHTSKVVSIETEDLTVDPVWRVPVLVHPKLSTPSEEPHENEQCVPEEPPLASPERSPSPAGQSLWSLERPSDRSSPYENTGTKDFIKNQISQRKGRRPPRWTADEDAMLRKLKSTTKLTYQELETQFPDRTGKALEQRWHGMKMNIVDDSHITSAKSSSPCASLPRITELGLPGPVIESKSTTVNMQTSPATNTSAEMTDSAVLLLSSHEDEGILEGRQRRAEHARRAYQKLTSENALKHNEIQDIDESQVNDPQVSSKDIEVAEECISTRRTKRGRRTKIRRPAMTKESPNDTTLTEASFEPSSSRTSRHMEALKDTSRLPKARRPKTTRTPGTPEVTASNYSTENPSITERPLETSLGDIESEKNKKHQAVHEPSSQDINTSTNSRNGRLEIRKTRFKEVSVIITRQDNREALASSTVLEPQSSKSDSCINTSSKAWETSKNYISNKLAHRARIFVYESRSPARATLRATFIAPGARLYFDLCDSSSSGPRTQAIQLRYIEKYSVEFTGSCYNIYTTILWKPESPIVIGAIADVHQSYAGKQTCFRKAKGQTSIDG
ncbi:hypothetical protein MMC18_000286 [Xylographa bjoerkii]|nr:hypothetical protein [Xylographa bjoerkii]